MTNDPTLIARVVGTLSGKPIRAVVVSHGEAVPTPYIVWRDYLATLGLAGAEWEFVRIAMNRVVRLPEGSRLVTPPPLVRASVVAMIEDRRLLPECRREIEVILNAGLGRLLAA